MAKLKVILKIISDESGTTAIEYGLIAALIVITAASALQTLSAAIKGSYENTAAQVQKSS